MLVVEAFSRNYLPSRRQIPALILSYFANRLTFLLQMGLHSYEPIRVDQSQHATRQPTLLLMVKLQARVPNLLIGS